jgi:flavin reductase (DIM6/NTAB) family NADH-FMN oxidoreductase RutF
MTIHTSHPFADPEPDPARRLRGRLGGAVTLWTAGSEDTRAGLTVTSVMAALGEPVHLLALVDPDSDLLEALTTTGRAVVQMLGWPDRDLAEAFAGTAPAPGGAFRVAPFLPTPWGPRLERASTWAGVSLDSGREVGWSQLVVVRVEHLEVGADDPDALIHHRGRFHRLHGR